MTPTEAGVLLAGIAVFDNRKHGTDEEAQRTMTLWSQALHDIALADAGAVVSQHFATSTEYLMPAHIRAGVRRIRDKRLADHPPLIPPRGLDVKGELAWIAEARRRVANGEVVDVNHYELVTSPGLPRALATVTEALTEPEEN